jgi:hypothetical protein
MDEELEGGSSDGGIGTGAVVFMATSSKTSALDPILTIVLLKNVFAGVGFCLLEPVVQLSILSRAVAVAHMFM